MNINRITASLIMAFAIPFSAQGAEVALYPTGPAQDSSFIRFVNGSANQSIDIKAAGSKVKITLDKVKPSTDFYAVSSKTNVMGRITTKNLGSDVNLPIKPGVFATIIAFSDENALTQRAILEEPDDFNSLKASIGFYNVDPQCPSAGLSVTGRSVALFEKVKINTAQRRSINPVNITIQLTCSDKPTGNTLTLSNLQAGERYTVFAVPEKKSSRIFSVTDSLAR